MMQTECKSEKIKLQDFGKRLVEVSFDGGKLSSDGGLILVRELELKQNIVKRFSSCFNDYRDRSKTDFSVLELLKQRIFGIVHGYEDLSDHDDLRFDSLMAVSVGRKDPTGQDRKQKKDKGKSLAGKSTLNRLELSLEEDCSKNRYKKIDYDSEKIEHFFVDHFISRYTKAPKEIILDIDATDDPLHGDQEGKYFHGYYKSYCYLPLYIFCGSHLLFSKLRTADIGVAKNVVEEFEWIIKKIRKAWKNVKIIIRGDGGFSSDEIMSWCEKNEVFYILGLSKNSRLNKQISQQLKKAGKKYYLSGKAARCYRDFKYRTKKSWSRKRRVVGKAEYLQKGPNQRFVVTNLGKEDYMAKELYENLYCARGDMENRIKEQQLALFADRTSTHFMRSNQLRLWFSGVAYIIINELRNVGLKGTGFAKLQSATIRNKFLKIGALLTISFRRFTIKFAEGYPYKELFRKMVMNIQADLE